MVNVKWWFMAKRGPVEPRAGDALEQGFHPLNRIKLSTRYIAAQRAIVMLPMCTARSLWKRNVQTLDEINIFARRDP